MTPRSTPVESIKHNNVKPPSRPSDFMMHLSHMSPPEMILSHESITNRPVTERHSAGVRLDAQVCFAVTAELVDTFVCVGAPTDVADQWSLSES